MPSLKRALGRLSRAFGGASPSAAPDDLPLTGHAEHRHPIRYVDPLSDEDLTALNRQFRWHAFTVDRHGRRFGGVAWRGKRDRPQPVPDPRIVLMNEHFDLAGKHVLEFGCFEGIHTVGLCQFAARVTAVDGRIENVMKTIVRAAMYGYCPTVFKLDVEAAEDPPPADVLHHVGVLYHLADPVGHLLRLGRFIGTGVMLDTHYARDEEALSEYAAGGSTFRYKEYRELGRADVFSGMSEHSKWLRMDDIIGLLRDTGFSDVSVIERREERNGPRALLIARRA
jgi:tRNA (mo5U34)-methyltransferase